MQVCVIFVNVSVPEPAHRMNSIHMRLLGISACDVLIGADHLLSNCSCASWVHGAGVEKCLQDALCDLVAVYVTRSLPRSFGGQSMRQGRGRRVRKGDFAFAKNSL